MSGFIWWFDWWICDLVADLRVVWFVSAAVLMRRLFGPSLDGLSHFLIMFPISWACVYSVSFFNFFSCCIFLSIVLLIFLFWPLTFGGESGYWESTATELGWMLVVIVWLVVRLVIFIGRLLVVIHWLVMVIWLYDWIWIWEVLYRYV